ncbi:uncharacterized protein L969DRAFT_44391 [Mixia osmundae IAM 14324]|uniref:Hepatocellular carcinoma-associated antigen 59 domain-containing protein n=1 Tax=Mixia osmundae (strain CBS 9802 / IAM 14324 / JCM 22182 / KY 12970) TaxID=764103 RepID=G7E845_MIXOS|nr:uncharacterized protein L969DRAFT_44391 [Mixia osmundae IAM 14324]KEI42403.1 hypothetical protein L969DRAFT_44391 [Mixia osmundae IAM 14324]GAA99005.1 hypothetical protein E5Q_05694 [Mixia osmundae IAM 14324]
MTEAVAQIAFKKRSRPAQTIKRPSQSDGNHDGPIADEQAHEPTDNLEDLLTLRKLRQATRKEGIDLERLNSGEAQRRKRAKRTEGDTNEYGLQSKDRVKDKEDDDYLLDDEDLKTRRLVKSNNFTQQTNTLDVDKHMMAYIEAELRKRTQKNPGQLDVEEELGKLDPHDELYQVAERYRVAKMPVREGNETTSSAMLTAVQEVDLGIDARLRNIEETEKAKQRLRELQNAPRPPKEEEDFNYARERFFRVSAQRADEQALVAAHREAEGLPPLELGKQSNRPLAATDEEVLERYRKRQRQLQQQHKR